MEQALVNYSDERLRELARRLYALGFGRNLVKEIVVELIWQDSTIAFELYDRNDEPRGASADAEYIASLLDGEWPDESRPDAILTAARAAHEWLKKDPTSIEAFEWNVLAHLLFQGGIYDRFEQYAAFNLARALLSMQALLSGLVEYDEMWSLLLFINLAEGLIDLTSDDNGVHQVTSGFFADLRKQDLKELQIQTSEDLYIRFRLHCQYAITQHVILQLLKTDIRSLVEEIVYTAAPLVIQGPFLQVLKGYFENLDDLNVLYTGDGPNDCIAEYGMREAALRHPKVREIFDLGPLPPREI